MNRTPPVHVMVIIDKHLLEACLTIRFDEYVPTFFTKRSYYRTVFALHGTINQAKYLDCRKYFLAQEPMPWLESNIEKLEPWNMDAKRFELAPYSAFHPVWASIIYSLTKTHASR